VSLEFEALPRKDDLLMEELRTVWARPAMREVALVTLLIVIVLVLTRLGRRAATRYIDDKDTRYRTRKAIGIVGLVVGLAIVLTSLSDRLGGLTVALAAASAGAAFALQEAIASVAGWLSLSFGGIYRIGDRVRLAGIVGDVIDISILRTTLMECGGWVKADLYNGTVVRVPNSHVLKEPVYNYSADFPFVWDEITVPVQHGSDYASARTIVQRVVVEVSGDAAARAKKQWTEMVLRYRIEDAQLDAVVTLAANDNWIELTARYVTDFRTRRRTKDLLFTKVLDQFATTEGRVVFASSRTHSV
jgi:small-conductance mechanosensitive channel